MLDYDTAIELMKKYGYSSTTHPYIYKNGDNIGICYTYVDDDFGELERIKIFEDKKSFEFFLEQLEFLKKNGRYYHIRMILDNYESTNPKVLFLRNEKLMVEGEMFDIENFDQREAQRDQMDDVSKIIYEAGDLLLVYDEIKGRQLQYLNNIVGLKNTLREKYFELQKEVDSFNKYKVERHLTLLSDVNDLGIDDRMEINLKDKYNRYIVQLPTYEEAVDFLKEVWEMNQNLELNTKYYETQKAELDTRNELKVVEQKLELMKKLNEDLKPFFGIDLVSKFRKINKTCSAESTSMSADTIQDNINRTVRKYSVFDSLDLIYVSDYLREAIQNTNYADLALKYSKNANKDFLRSYKMPLNEVASSLSIQYRDKLDLTEQAILVLYNNHKYRMLCNAILEIDGFDSLPVKKLVSKVSAIKGFSKIKSECYDAVKKRLNDPSNATIKQSLFSNFDFTTFESFITSLIRELVKLRNVNNKMIICGDINMYLGVNNPQDVLNKKFVMVTNDLNSLLVEAKESNSMVGITLLKKNTPVLYSPYYLDIGDIYSKDASLQMTIKEMINFELLVEISDVIVNVDSVKTNVVRYYSKPEVVENISVVNDLKKNFKTTFCKIAFTNGLNEAIPEAIPAVVPAVDSSPQVVEMNQTSVVTNAVDNSVVVSPVIEQPVLMEQPAPIEQSVSAEPSVTEVAETTESETQPVIENSISNVEAPTIAENVENKEVNSAEPTLSTKEAKEEKPVIQTANENKEEKQNAQVSSNNQKQVVKQTIGVPSKQVVKVGNVGNKQVTTTKLPNSKVIVQQQVGKPSTTTNKQPVNGTVVNKTANGGQVKVVGGIGKPTKQVVKVGQPVKPNNK